MSPTNEMTIETLKILLDRLDLAWVITLRRWDENFHQWTAERRFDGKCFGLVWQSNPDSWALLGEVDGDVGTVATASSLDPLLGMLPAL